MTFPEEDDMFYFAYCTWMDESELRRNAPNAVFVIRGKAINHKLEFRAIKDTSNRGWCHVNNDADARGEVLWGIVYELTEAESIKDYEGFERLFLKVRGDDGNNYDCFTYRLVKPGLAIRPPDCYVQHIFKGALSWNLPSEYQAKLRQIFKQALPCPNENTRASDGMRKSTQNE